MIFSVASACAGTQVKQEPIAEPMGPAQAIGVPLPEGGKPVILVLGPGQAHGFAHVGVIRALQTAGIPIAGVTGTEMGALIGALYANMGRAQQFEGGLARFKEEVFEVPKSLLSFGRDKDTPNKGEKIEQVLKQVFPAQDVSQTRVPFRLAVQRVGGGAVVLERGSLKGALRAAIAHPTLFSPADWEGQKTQSAESTRPYLVSEARGIAQGIVVVVDCSTDAERAPFQDELGKAELVIRPDFSGLARSDFAKRNEIAFRGKTALLKALPELRRLTGLPEPKKEDDGGEN